MTAIKARSVSRLILDFSAGKCSKNRIKNAIRNCEIVSVEPCTHECNQWNIYNNQIKVGMYTIHLQLPFDGPDSWRKLKDYGDFQVTISDGGPAIDLKKDGRFKNQYWVPSNFFGKLRIKHLIDIVAHCHRLNKLRAFL